MTTSQKCALLVLATSVAACNGNQNGGQCAGENLENRAYIVSNQSDEVHVIDLCSMEVVGIVHTGGQALHMLELDKTFTKAYVDSSETGETVVFDARTLQVSKRLKTGNHPTHLTLSRDGKVLALVAENDNALTFIDTATDVAFKKLPGFYQPHFPRWTADGKTIYVANIRGNHLTRVDAATLEIVDHIALDGFAGPPSAALLPDESGFADAQIDADGILYAAHAGTGRVLVYDTLKKQKLPELVVGNRPWIVYADHPFTQIPRRPIVPNFGDSTVSLLSGVERKVVATMPGADTLSYGVNYSSQAPDRAYLMNRMKQEIAVLDTARNTIIHRIPVGGNTETASTTPDGKLIVATVSSANRVVVIEAATGRIVKTFDNIGKYPWSVTIPRGQNYCH